MTNRQATMAVRDNPSEYFMTVGEYFNFIGQPVPEVGPNGEKIDPYDLFMGVTKSGEFVRIDKQGNPVRTRGR
jgi:hypothetical protein